jgi:hypothetical protein
MGIVAFVAGVTVNRGFILIQMSRMATVAHHYTVLAEQGIFRVSIMIETRGFPLLHRMTFVAFLSEAIVMDIVLLVAGVTVSRCFVLVQGAFMASVALGFSVIASERIGGIAIMLKQHGFPIPFGVAAYAGLAEPAFMRIIFLMASEAICRRFILVKISLMA